MATTSLTLDDDLEARIGRLADERGQPAEALMREVLSQYVKRVEAHAQFVQEAIESWEDYKKTGLHITEEELFDWLDTWGTPDERPAPACHR